LIVLLWKQDLFIRKDVVQIGLEKEFWKDPDGSVWIDLTDEGLDRKIVLRSDGTGIYDSGYWYCYSTCERFSEIGGMVYTVGNEQDYHFKVLFLILKNWVLIGLIAYIIYHTEW
jgi:arginyl-tRNA synthetase